MGVSGVDKSVGVPVIHPDSQHTIDAIIKGAPHALLLTGPTGIGLATIAESFVSKGAQRMVVLPRLPETKGGAVDLEKGRIRAEDIRNLYDITRLVEPGGRTIIIDYAETMLPAAQNAFLKLLEEPTAGTHFILLTHNAELLLPTITSRTQRVDIRPITHSQSEALLDALGVTDATKRAQLLFIAEGLPALMTRLVQDTSVFEARAGLVKDARGLITGTGYDRLVIAKKYKDSRVDALTLVEDALKLLRRTIAQNGDVQSLKLLTRLEVIHKRLSEQGNVRLQLSATVLS